MILGPVQSAIISAWPSVGPKHYHTFSGGHVPIVEHRYSPIMPYLAGGNAVVSRTIGSARPKTLVSRIVVFNVSLHRGDNMTRYRISGPDEFQAILEASGTLWERPIIDAILINRLPDHSQDHLPLSDCCIGTIEWKLSEPHGVRCGNDR